MTNGDQKIAEEDKQAIQFDQEARQRPAEKNKEDPGGKGSGALEFLGTSEEDHGLLDADYEGEADEEEDLGLLVRGRGREWCAAYVAHGESIT